MNDGMKNQQKEANGQNKRDEESGTKLTEDHELKRKKRMKIAIYVIAFVLFQVIVITAFGMTVMKVKSPKVRLSNIRFQNLQSTTSSSSFDISFVTQVRVKNTNFGTYKFENTTATFTYHGKTVGQVVIPKGKAGFKSTKKMDVSVNLNFKALPTTNTTLGSNLSSGILTLISTAKTKGKVTLMLIMKKNKSADMYCTIAIDLSAKTVKELKCK